MRIPAVVALGCPSFAKLTRMIEASDDFCVLRRLPTLCGVLDVLRRTRPELFILGMKPPFAPVFEIIRSTGAEQGTKTVVMCDRDDAGWAVEALHQGAAAYLFADTTEADALRMLRLVSRQRTHQRVGEPSRVGVGQAQNSRIGVRSPAI